MKWKQSENKQVKRQKQRLLLKTGKLSFRSYRGSLMYYWRNGLGQLLYHDIFALDTQLEIL